MALVDTMRGRSVLAGQLQPHARHRILKSPRAGNFAGRRLRTIRYHCLTCDQLVGLEQEEVRSGQQ